MITVLYLTITAFCIVMLFKNYNTYKNRLIINDAIHERHVAYIRSAYDYNNPDLLDDAKLVDYCHKESYTKTLFRLWDWGYTHILPKEKFELIERYIS